MIPTSNHNVYCVGSVLFRLYIFWFLHQTTTAEYHLKVGVGCISFDSYIKPQLHGRQRLEKAVVYLLIPTSNHNCPCSHLPKWMLYIFWFLHQTTTPVMFTSLASSCISFDSYIKPQLSLRLCRLLLVVYLLIPTSNHNLLCNN